MSNFKRGEKVILKDKYINKYPKIKSEYMVVDTENGFKIFCVWLDKDDNFECEWFDNDWLESYTHRERKRKISLIK
jgi:hypothetical protein